MTLHTRLTHRWIPKQEWGVSSDPSGRAVSIHTAAYANGDKAEKQ